MDYRVFWFIKLAPSQKLNLNMSLTSKKLDFSSIPTEKSWSFSDKTIKDTAYISHGYYTYPAKFIPQLADRIIKENSIEGDIVIDPFMGSGTSILEAMVNKRIGIGVDINEVACLLAKVKTTPIKAVDLTNEFIKIQNELEDRLNGQHTSYIEKISRRLPKHERIDYWFPEEQRLKLSIILDRISEIKNRNIKDFFLIAFAQILKSCSIWLQKSVKPTRDFNKKLSDPHRLFILQTKKMLRKHGEFCSVLTDKTRNNIEQSRKVACRDSRKLPCKDGQAALIVTSPPYVTSYEYADLHQLPALWFSYLDELPQFRKKFIGSSSRNRQETNLKSITAKDIISQLKNKKRNEARSYFADMLESFLEMKRVIRRGGRAAIVIGNTKFNGIEILNAEVFQEQFENIGFKTHKIIHREIPSKMLPSVRDPKTGRFTVITDKNKKLAYPTEYILIMEKL